MGIVTTPYWRVHDTTKRQVKSHLIEGAIGRHGDAREVLCGLVTIPVDRQEHQSRYPLCKHCIRAIKDQKSYLDWLIA